MKYFTLSKCFFLIFHVSWRTDLYLNCIPMCDMLSHDILTAGDYDCRCPSAQEMLNICIVVYYIPL